MNTLYFGDNLEVMREMDDQRVDLICTDPPFNSGRDYNAFLTETTVLADRRCLFSKSGFPAESYPFTEAVAGTDAEDGTAFYKYTDEF